MNPLISVITVCHNAGQFIEQCIESVADQGFKDYEHVVIDGGSTDGTVDIIRRHEAHLAYWHSRPDRGLAHALNQGVEHSRGEWLIFLNSDDWFIDDSALSRMSGQLMQNKNADVVFGRVQIVTRERYPRPLYSGGGPWRWREFRRHDTIPHQAAFTNREYFQRFGGFSEEFRIAVDYEHYLRAGKTLSTVFAPELVSCQRINGLSWASLSNTLRECSAAQRKHNVWPAPWIAEVLSGFYMVRGSISRRMRKRWFVTK